MRVTQSMLASNSLRNLSKSYTDLMKYNDQLQTGKKISRPSDDPVVAVKGIAYRTNLTEVEQYKRNLSDAYTWLENSEAGIEQAKEVIQRVRELLIEGKNGTNNPEDLKAIQVEIGQLKEDLAGVANMQVAGRYIFNGTDTARPPIALNPDGSVQSININTKDFNIEVSKGVQLKVNINAENVFGKGLLSPVTTTAGEGTLSKIEQFLNGIGNHDPDQLLGELDSHFDKLSGERSGLGARYNRLELIDDRLESQEVFANRILSENEDADMEKIITDLTTQESVHRASLAASSRIIQPTLIDFLR